VTSPPDGPAADVDLRCYRHPDRSTGIRCVRCDRPICPDCMIPASVGFHCPECVSEGRRTLRQARTVYGGKVRTGSRPDLVTLTLIGINVVVFIITTASGASILNGSGGGASSIYAKFALVPVQVAHGEWWRLFTSAFLHYGIFHIGFNMYALYIIGPPLEAALGRLRYATLYVLAGVGGAVLSMAFGNIFEQAAGASGAIYGLFGAFYVVARHRNISTNGIVITIVVNLIFTFSGIANIDWHAHVGGIITGAVVAVIYAAAPASRRNQLQAAGVVALIVVIAVGGFLGAHHVRDKCPHLVTSNGVILGCER
jgi:membrane associated rhomboid family serine protease